MSVGVVVLSHAVATIEGFPDLPLVLLGVEMFFVISGFIITHLLLEELDRTRSISLSHFYARRARRILPVFWSYLLVVLLLQAAGRIAVSRTQWLFAATLTWNYRELWDITAGDGAWFLGHLWTLSMEEQFYLVWPVTLLLAGKARALRLALGAICALPVIRVLTYLLLPSMREPMGTMFHTACDPIVAGCALALLQGHRGFRAMGARLASPILPVASTAYLILVDPALVLHYRGSYEFVVGKTIRSIALVLIVHWLLSNRESVASRALNSRAFVHVGTISYGLYLWQQLFLTPINQTWTGRFPVNVLCALVTAEVSYFGMERWFLARKRGAPGDERDPDQTPAAI